MSAMSRQSDGKRFQDLCLMFRLHGKGYYLRGVGAMSGCEVWVFSREYKRWLGCVDISHLSPVIPSKAINLKSVNGECATILDSSLRCAAFRMTEDKGAPFRLTGDEGAPFRLTE